MLLSFLASIDSDCTETLGHYNPLGVNHALPSEEPNDALRHVGALGNIVSLGGVAKYDEVCATEVKLRGDTSIIGRGFTIHEEDDQGGAVDKDNGAAGSRVACGNIFLI